MKETYDQAEAKLVVFAEGDVIVCSNEGPEDENPD